MEGRRERGERGEREKDVFGVVGGQSVSVLAGLGWGGKSFTS